MKACVYVKDATDTPRFTTHTVHRVLRKRRRQHVRRGHLVAYYSGCVELQSFLERSDVLQSKIRRCCPIPRPSNKTVFSMRKCCLNSAVSLAGRCDAQCDVPCDVVTCVWTSITSRHDPTDLAPGPAGDSRGVQQVMEWGWPRSTNPVR